MNYKIHSCICKWCMKDFMSKYTNAKFCCGSCKVSYLNKHRVWKDESKQKLRDRNQRLNYSKEGNPNFKNAKINFTCMECGIVFGLYKWEKKSGKFCSRACYKNHKSKNRFRTLSDIEIRIHSNISRGIRNSINSHKDNVRWNILLGYSLSDLIIHLENKFKDGMSWQNYGVHGWHIDHKKPITHFKFKSYLDEEFLECWSLDNLQPMWCHDNWAKGNLKNKNKEKYEFI